MLPLALLSVVLLATTTQVPSTRLYPALEAVRSGHLAVSDRHSLYWEESGNPEGVPAIVLHGGPGGKSAPVMRRLFDPQRYRIIQFDQRGAGRSTPFADTRDNTTQALVADINRLRDHLGIRGKVVLLGLSWGSTLALAYATANPDQVAGLVLLGLFTCTDAEIDHLYHGGVRPFYPDAVVLLESVIPYPNRRTYPRQLYEVISGADTAKARAAVQAFVVYEEWLSNAGGTQNAAVEEAADSTTRSLAVLENYYMMHRCFLRPNELLTGLSALRGIPTYIANGRLDMLTPPHTARLVAEALPGSRLELVPGAGHVDLGVALAAVRATQWLAETIRR